jgi:hypothetical protein
MVNNCSERVEAFFGSLVPGDPKEDWDFHSVANFADPVDAVKEVDRLHKKFLPYMEEMPGEDGGTTLSWFSLEMEVRPEMYTMIYWPGRPITAEEVLAYAANTWIETTSKNVTQH